MSIAVYGWAGSRTQSYNSGYVFYLLCCCQSWRTSWRMSWRMSWKMSWSLTYWTLTYELGCVCVRKALAIVYIFLYKLLTILRYHNSPERPFRPFLFLLFLPVFDLPPSSLCTSAMSVSSLTQQLIPSPMKPSWQRQSNNPSWLIQFACTWQLSMPREHSFTSAHVQ